MILVVGMVVTGLIVGWLGRLLVPGPNPMSLIATTFVGLGGAVLGGTIGNLFFSPTVALFCAIPGAAVMAWLVDQARGPTDEDINGGTGPMQ